METGDFTVNEDIDGEIIWCSPSHQAALSELADKVVGMQEADQEEKFDCGSDCRGWDIFNNDKYGLEIERCDECQRFANDEEAAALPEAQEALATALANAESTIPA